MLNTDKLCMGCMKDKGEEKICPICGYDESENNPQNMLPKRTVLHNRYVIGRYVSVNGEGITYLAWDNSSDIAVHIREYFPSECALRLENGEVGIIEENKYAFNEGLIEFMEINKALKDGELTAIVSVNSIFEENGTIYSVSPIIQSITLEDFLVRNGGSLKWEQARPLFLPLIDTIGRLHKKGIIHGGISPQTIIVGRDGKLRLSNLSIKRVRDSSSGFSTELYDGYQAAEQYSIPKLAISESTDVYALCSVLFRVLIGTVPPKASERLEKDTLSIPAHFAEELPRQVLVSIANGMQVLPSKRTQNIETFKNEIVYGETAENKAAVQNRNKPAENAVSSSSKKNKKDKAPSSAKYAVISALVTALIFISLGGLVVLKFKDEIFNKEEVPLNTSSDFITESSGPQLGDYDSKVVNSVKLYNVPKLVGKYYYQLEDDEDLEKFKIEIAGKAYSNKVPRGAICEQSIKEGTGVEKNTTVKVTISLGPKDFKVANVIGLTEQEARIELMKQGFLYENIIAEDEDDPNAKTGVVLDMNPEEGSKTNAEAVVHIFINRHQSDNETASAVSGAYHQQVN